MLIAPITQLIPFRHPLAAPISSLTPQLEPINRACLDVWINTLMPADEQSLSAVELGVPQRLVDKGASDDGYLKLIVAGCRWLDSEARRRGARDFSGLDTTDREDVASLAERSEADSLPLVFFENTLEDTFHFYYARRESWVMLGYDGPPQPRGFMNYAQPPRT
jgi:hypothetical protein